MIHKKGFKRLKLFIRNIVCHYH